jgi:hypothetical protein
MDTDLLLERLRNNHTNAKQVVLKQESARDACIIAKSYLASQSYGFVLESWIKTHLNLDDKVDNSSGDASQSAKTFEIKVSIEDGRGKFNYVQIRPAHSVDAYIILNYSITLDEVIWLYIPHDSMNYLINQWGGYAHGTITQQGPITLQSIQDNSYEYAIRPNMHKPNIKDGRAWQELTNYKVSEDELRQILHKA